MRLKSPTGAQDGTTPAPPREKPTTYRTVGSLVTGLLLIVFGLIGFLAFGFGAGRHPLGAAIAFLLAVAGFVGGLYPAAYSYRERFVIRNPFRLITVPWPRMAEATARLSMVVTTREAADDAETEALTGEKKKTPKFTVWAVPVSMHDRRKADRNTAKQAREVRNAAMRAARGSNPDAMMHGGIGAPSPSAAARRGENERIESMAFADQAIVEMRDRQRACDTAFDASEPVTVQWTWYTLGAAGVAVLLVLLAAVGVAI
jgi:hypothetical protein